MRLAEIGMVKHGDMIVWRKKKRKVARQACRFHLGLRESRQHCRRALKLGDMVKCNALERKTREEGR